ncbi:MAG TPA: malic enzyme-like NAD(P)-binding protein [Thermodesulfobacteriota bacterium]|nr:malic enzyme-like NAD(P)-binding protein [Thermodesulfobacteriota bacterium]
MLFVDKLTRTLRCRNDQRPGVFGALATAIGQEGGLLGDVRTVSVGRLHIVRDVTVYVDDEAHLERLIARVRRVEGVQLVAVIDDVLEAHEGGKIVVKSRRPVRRLSDLRRAYTPGVAQVCRLLKADPEKANIYTTIPRTVAVVTDGTAILGLGDIGPVAGMPVMEGKAALFHDLVGLSAVPILLATKDPDEIVRTVINIAPTFGAIQLEDIAAPACFEIEARLSAALDKPVLHDDQHGTAVVTLAALLAACRQAGLDLRRVRYGQIGLGAAGLATSLMVMRYTGTPVLGTDIREDAKARLRQAGGRVGTLAEVLAEADVVVATTGVPGLIKPEWIRRGQVILALSNPDPEITPEAALAAGAAFAADGRAVNNVLGFPGLFKGALDARASRFTYEMLIAAAEAIAARADEGELVPSPLDLEVHQAVARAVARAAIASGVARAALDEDYFSGVETPRGEAGER